MANAPLYLFIFYDYEVVFFILGFIKKRLLVTRQTNCTWKTQPWSQAWAKGSHVSTWWPGLFTVDLVGPTLTDQSGSKWVCSPLAEGALGDE